jgi:insecticidal toxin complex protein TccC
MMTSLHSHTPTLNVIEPRGLPVRSVAWCRSADDGEAEARIHRVQFDAIGREVAQWDPRLWARLEQDPSTPANLLKVHTLSGVVLSTVGVDAGLRVSLPGDAGQLVHSWDGRGSELRNQYDALLRPTALFEKALNGDTFACISRYDYGSADADSALYNQCGQLIRHDDLAGTRHFPAFGLHGEALEQQQYFLKDPEPENETGRDALLESQRYTTRFAFNALGEITVQTDARDNQQLFVHTLDGRLREMRLLQANTSTATVLASHIQYNAQGQITQQMAGNGVVSRYDYCPRDGQLIRLSTGSLQDLNYSYDPVGNIISIEDKAQAVRHFARQRIDPINRYTYDSLYQLIHATGWESGTVNQGPAQLPDPQAAANYQQTYRYDAGGNLLELTHQGPQSHSRVLEADHYSNRCLPVAKGRRLMGAHFAAGFDENGNLLALNNSRSLTWDLRNQLTHVRLMERDGAVADCERYIYGADGMRQRKIRSIQTNARTVTNETRYLPGLELRINPFTGETLQVINVQVGLNTVQVLHWASTSPKGLVNDYYRYTLADHLGSCSLELDSDARIISRETYHPFGSTAFSDTGNSSEASYRTLRYSGKELDATGLYYYGQRYYIPWLQRWVNADPEGEIDGLNLYRMVRNNPINFIDEQGLTPTKKVGTDSSKDLTSSKPKKFKTESKRGLFKKVTNQSPRVRERHISSTGDSDSEDPNVLYRALRADELQPQFLGLSPPAVNDPKITAYQHVAHGSTAKVKSKWISASRSLKVAAAWAGENKLRVVKFSKPAKTTVFDLTTEQGREAMLNQHNDTLPEGKRLTPESSSKAMNFAKGSQEVVINGGVIASRILAVYEAKTLDEAEHEKFREENPTYQGYDKIFNTRSKVTYKDKKQKTIRWTTPKTVLLKRVYSRPGI